MRYKTLGWGIGASFLLVAAGLLFPLAATAVPQESFQYTVTTTVSKPGSTLEPTLSLTTTPVLPSATPAAGLPSPSPTTPPPPPTFTPRPSPTPEVTLTPGLSIPWLPPEIGRLLALYPIPLALSCSLLLLLLLAIVLILIVSRRRRPPTPTAALIPAAPPSAPPSPAPQQPYLQSVAVPTAPPFVLRPEGVTIGRSAENDLVITEDMPGWETVSQRHASIYQQQGRWIIEDLQSINGVYVNGRRTGHNRLRDGWRIGIGGVEFDFHTGTGEAEQ